MTIINSRPIVRLLFLSFLLCTDVSADERTLAGYSNELTVRPGDTVEFKVSKLGGGQYEADLVRVVNGET
jgi:hypothetical protein